jgi:rSAM/selenodomain-associated transferase 2
MKLSVIIPTLNEEISLGKTFRAVKQLENVAEIIVVDGGSEDGTLEIAKNLQAKIVTAKRGRGSQLDAGAQIATGDVLWFLHADTLPAQNAPKQIFLALHDERVMGGNFEIRFDGKTFAAKMLTWLYPKLRLLNLCYGDSAFFVRREIYQKCGGFRDISLFEDVEFYQRVKKRGRFIHLTSSVTSSSRRFEGRSFALTFARWSLFQGLYWLGFPPEILAKYYAPVRK